MSPRESNPGPSTSPPPFDSDPLPTISKGKGRATSPEPSERTPLLRSSSPAHSSPVRPTRARSRLRAILLRVFLSTLALSIFLLAILAGLAYSYASRVRRLSPDDLLHRAIVLRGPDSLTVHNITTDGSLWIQLGGRVGVDAGAILGVTTPADGEDGDGVLRYLWKSWGRQGIRTLDRVTVQLSPIQLAAGSSARTELASIEIPSLELPLTADPPQDLSWLTPVSIPVCIYPTDNVTALTEFARRAWMEGSIFVGASVDRVEVTGGGLGESGWRSKIKAARTEIYTVMRKKLPHVPGLPTPGNNAPFPPLSDLINLKSFSVSSGNHTLLIHATASVPNPLPPSIDVTVPSMPFIVSIPASPLGNNTEDTLPVASLVTPPITPTHPNITFNVSGRALALPSIPSRGPSPLSAFLARYLSLAPNPITIFTPLMPAYVVPAFFPPPPHRPHILRNVTIRDMRIKPAPDGAFLASGTVFARIVLPKGMNVQTHVHRVLPDVLIYDGPVPDPAPSPLPIPPSSLAPNAPKRAPLPEPIPEGAFGHIRPEDWLHAVSVPSDNDGPEDGSAVAVSAKINDVPIDVLPGRQREFSDFVGKVVFGSQGALAGLEGTVAVGVNVQGFPSRGDDKESNLELEGLPFRGSVRVGKKGAPRWPST